MNSRLLLSLDEEKQRAISAIRKHCCDLLDMSHRFKYFTIHGTKHIDNLFRILDIFIDGGLTLSGDEAFLLGCAICTHDIGMVTPLSVLKVDDVFGGMPQPPDPAKIDRYIRDIHHKLVDQYMNENFDFLAAVGLSVSQCSIVKEIAKCHRKEDLGKKHGYVAKLGALLRILDELDIYSSRAPLDVLLRDYKDMDATSCWHWFKHNICDDWMINHNVFFQKDINSKIIFKVAVHPTHEKSIPYWLSNVVKPIHRELIDEGAGKILISHFGLQIMVQISHDLSYVFGGSCPLDLIEQKALSAGRKVILVVDDEVRKMEDLFLQLMDSYHILYSPNTKDALEKLNATKVDLVIIDLQIGSGFMWSSEETGGYKMTGLRLVKEIKEKFSDTIPAIFTGSKYDLSEIKELDGLAFFLRKPIDPERFAMEVIDVLG